MPILVYRNDVSKNYSVYQSPVLYNGGKQIELHVSEIEQEHYQSLFWGSKNQSDDLLFIYTCVFLHLMFQINLAT